METETSSADEGEAMRIDEAPLLQDWRDQYLNWINQGVLYPQTALGRDDSPGGRSLLS